MLILGYGLSGCVENTEQKSIDNTSNISSARASADNQTEKGVTQDYNTAAKVNWVLDVNYSEALEIMGEMEKMNQPRPEGSKYELGPSKNITMDVGIYFNETAPLKETQVAKVAKRHDISVDVSTFSG